MANNIYGTAISLHFSRLDHVDGILRSARLAGYLYVRTVRFQSCTLLSWVIALYILIHSKPF